MESAEQAPHLAQPAMLRRAAGSFPPMPPEMPGASKTYSLPINFSAR
ncbi:hypothetical protein ACIKT0_17290 [Hansschlegelia beijingensis]